MGISGFKLALILMFSFCVEARKNIIFDLGGVLLKPNKFNVAYNIGFGNIFWHMIQDFKIPSENKIFELLSLFNDQEVSGPMACPLCPNGVKMPDIMIDWMTGALTGPQIINFMDKSIDDLYSKKYFISRAERNVIRETIRAIFDPSVLGNNIKTIKSGFKLVKECSKKNNLYVLSNWDKLSFEKVYNSNINLFQYFNKENIFISADYGTLKPYANFYQCLLNEHKLNPKDCIFIDDQLENIEAAEKLGIKSIWLNNGNYKQVKKKLIELGAI